MLNSVLTSHRYSLRRNLMLLVIVCVMPAALVSATLAYSNYRLQRDHVEQQTVLMARTILADLEREIATIESALKILATANELSAGDLRSFHQRAVDALAPGIAHNYIVTDRRGRQILNTLQPYGEALPTTGTPPQIARVFTDHATVLTDMFTGQLTQLPAIAIGVPVEVHKQIAYSLNMGLDPRRITAILNRQKLPRGWLAAVSDSSGTIVGRSRDAELYVGKKAVPELVEAIAQNGDGQIQVRNREGIAMFVGYATSGAWRWSVVVGAPKVRLEYDMAWQLARVLVGVLAALGLGIWLAHTISMRVLLSVRELNDAALSLSKGEDVQLPTMQLEEAEAVGHAMRQAAQAMKKVKFLAQHDALTELPNRLLFDEVAEHDLAFASRRGQTMALLAVDLDGFKGVNDTHGHAAGDAVLKTVAQRIQEIIRASDIAARIGGDEFIIMLTDVNQESALETAERIIALLSMAYADCQVSVSASVGVALYPECGDTLKTLTAAADQAMYLAKQSGKQRVVLAPPRAS